MGLATLVMISQDQKLLQMQVNCILNLVFKQTA